MRKPKVIGKSTIVDEFAKERGVSKVNATKDIAALIGIIHRHAEKHENVRFVNEFEFRATHRKARKGRNPQTGQPIHIASRWHYSISDGKKLKHDMNK